LPEYAYKIFPKFRIARDEVEAGKEITGGNKAKEGIGILREKALRDGDRPALR
jgi:hypothetical protein